MIDRKKLLALADAWDDSGNDAALQCAESLREALDLGPKVHLQFERALPHRGQLWRHFKGTIYQIVEVGPWRSPTAFLEGEFIVAYRQIGARKDPEIETNFRLLDDFMMLVPEGRENENVTGQTYRFEHHPGEW